MLSVRLKTLNNILMCFDGKKKQPFEKKTRESMPIVIKECRKY